MTFKIFRSHCLFLNCLFWTSVSIAVDLDQLVSQLSGDNEVQRSEARQLLAREGATPVPLIVPLLAHDDERVWRAASNVLADIAHDVSEPGREEERWAVSEALMTLLVPDQADTVKMRAMRLLPLVVPEGFDVAPLSRLLDDPEVRENARACLEEIGTSEAGLALCEGLESPDADFVCAILNSLREVGPGGCTRRIRELMEGDDAHIRICAARALAIIPNPEISDAFWKVVDRATPETRLEAERMFLDYLESLGMNSPFVSNFYERSLEKFSFAPTRGAALIGLAGTAGTSAIDRIVEAVNDDASGDSIAPAIAAFETLKGEEAAEALIAAYSKAPTDLQTKMVYLFVRSGNPVYGPFLSDLAETGDSVVQAELLKALGESDLVEPLARLVRMTSEEERQAGLSILLAAARRFETEGKTDLSGEAFGKVYEIADSEDVRREALLGLGRNPSVDLLDSLLEGIEKEAFGEDTAAVLVRVARKVNESGNQEAREKALHVIRAKANTTEIVRQILQLAGPDESANEVAESLGFVTHWSVAGPFPWDPLTGFGRVNVGEPSIDLTAVYRPSGEEVRWKEYDPRDSLATVDLGGAIGNLERVCAYGYSEIDLEEETEAEVRAGSDDGIKIWINGEPVHENLVDRGSDLDQDRAAVRLKKGKNEILVCVTQGGGGWNFRLRLTRADGSPLPFDHLSR